MIGQSANQRMMEAGACIACKLGLPEDSNQVGIEINNFSVEMFPPRLLVCKKCTEDVVIKLMTNQLNLKNIPSLVGGMLKGLKKK